MSESKYTFNMVISSLIFIFVIGMALFTCQAYGDKALNDALQINGLTLNSTDVSSGQTASIIAAASLQTMPPGSEMQILTSAIIGLIIGVILVFVLVKFLGKFVVKCLFLLSLGTLLLMFFTSFGYTIFGSPIFTPSYILTLIGIDIIILLTWLSYPEWWVISGMSILLAIAGASFFGASLPPSTIIGMFIILSIYDYIAVLRSNVMMKFAKGVMDIHLPAAITLPYNKKSSMITGGINFSEEVKERSDKGFMVLGTGDLLFPTILAVSTSLYISTIGGIIVGICIMMSYIVLMYTLYYSEFGKKVQGLPGLPFLCSGAIIGYIITILII